MSELVTIRTDETLKKTLQKLTDSDRRNLSGLYSCNLKKIIEQSKGKK